MKNSTAYLSALFPFLIAIVSCSPARAQTVIPQIVDGGGWQTTLVFINTSSNSAQVNVTFNQETGGGATALWAPPFIDATTTQFTLAPGETVIIHTAGTASTTTVGWALIQGDASVGVYAIFAQSAPGLPNQDGTALASAASSRVLVPYDNTHGFVTAIAIANTGSTTVTINVGLKNTFAAGLVSPAPLPITLPPLGHVSFTMPQQFTPTSNQIGTAEFTTNGGSISVIALRFDPTGSFASAPAFAESGAAILSNGSGTGGGGSLPAFSSLTISASGAGASLLNIFVNSVGLGYSGQASGFTPSGAQFSATWNTVAINGLNLVFTGFDPARSQIQGAEVSSGSLSLTLTPQALVTSGAVSGTINLVNTLGSISGMFTGTYSVD